MKASRLLMGFGDTANIIQIYPLPPSLHPPNRLMRGTANITHISAKYSKYTKLVKVDRRNIFRGLQFMIDCENLNFKRKNIETRPQTFFFGSDVHQGQSLSNPTPRILELFVGPSVCHRKTSHRIQPMHIRCEHHPQCTMRSSSFVYDAIIITMTTIIICVQCNHHHLCTMRSSC